MNWIVSCSGEVIKVIVQDMLMNTNAIIVCTWHDLQTWPGHQASGKRGKQRQFENIHDLWRQIAFRIIPILSQRQKFMHGFGPKVLSSLRDFSELAYTKVRKAFCPGPLAIPYWNSYPFASDHLLFSERERACELNIHAIINVCATLHISPRCDIQHIHQALCMEACHCDLYGQKQCTWSPKSVQNGTLTSAWFLCAHQKSNYQ